LGWWAVRIYLIADSCFFFGQGVFLLLAAGSVIQAWSSERISEGAVGDLRVLALVRKFPPQASAMDERDGMQAFHPAEKFG
jgi:hypothetical protein